jgi:hypothetical protein
MANCVVAAVLSRMSDGGIAREDTRLYSVTLP